jgi:hypothetical protein
MTQKIVSTVISPDTSWLTILNSTPRVKEEKVNQEQSQKESDGNMGGYQ